MHAHVLSQSDDYISPNHLGYLVMKGRLPHVDPPYTGGHSGPHGRQFGAGSGGPAVLCL